MVLVSFGHRNPLFEGLAGSVKGLPLSAAMSSATRSFGSFTTSPEPLKSTSGKRACEVEQLGSRTSAHTENGCIGGQNHKPHLHRQVQTVTHRSKLGKLLVIRCCLFLAKDDRSCWLVHGASVGGRACEALVMTLGHDRPIFRLPPKAKRR